MFKANNKNTRTTSLTSFWCFYCYLCTYLTPSSYISIVDFEQVNVTWEPSNHSAPFRHPNFKVSKNRACQNIWFKSISK